MEYKVDYLEDKKIVQVKVKGRVNYQIVQQYSIEAVKLARENNCRKFLINHSKTLLEDGIYKIHTDGDALEKFGFKIQRIHGNVPPRLSWKFKIFSTIVNPFLFCRHDNVMKYAHSLMIESKKND